MNFKFHPAAAQEYSDAAHYYDGQAEGLGDRFVAEIEKGISRICRAPLSWGILSRNTRRCLANHFPYGIIYVVDDGRIFILAVMHLKRKPGYWETRLRDIK